MKFIRVLAIFLIALASVHTPALAQSRGLPDFVELAEKQSPSVVNISTVQKARGQPMINGMPVDPNDPAYEILRRFFPQQQPGGAQPESRSLGSGFIISADGYVMTNAHVVDGADEVTVRLLDKREFRAKIVGTDKRTDIALLKIEASGLPAVRMGDSNLVKPGEWVVAIGSPFGFEHSVTAGIVSAKGRALPQENYVPFIQTDVAINPGNSGGPLFNLRGEVIGINSQIFSRSGGFMGISFAIPIDLAMDVQQQLRSRGKASHGRIGIAIQEVTREMAESFGLSRAGGALVNTVEANSPAARGGIEAGDVILRFDGKPVTSSSDLPRIVGAMRPGSKAQVDVWRKGQTKSLAVTIGDLDSATAAAKQAQLQTAGVADNKRLGVVLSELTPDLRQRLGFDAAATGIVIIESRANNRLNLRPGDLILGLAAHGEMQAVRSVAQFNQWMNQIDARTAATLQIRRGNAQIFVPVPPLVR